MIHLTTSDLRRLKGAQSQQIEYVRYNKQSSQRPQANPATTRTPKCTERPRITKKSYIRELTLVNGKYSGEDMPI